MFLGAINTLDFIVKLGLVSHNVWSIQVPKFQALCLALEPDLQDACDVLS